MLSFRYDDRMDPVRNETDRGWVDIWVLSPGARRQSILKKEPKRLRERALFPISLLSWVLFKEKRRKERRAFAHVN